MKRKLAICLLVAGVLTGGLAHAETKSILMLVQGGHSGESNVRQLGAWIEDTRPGKYRIDYSPNVSPNVLDSATALTQQQRDLLESYDLIVMPRFGVGGSTNFASHDWNTIETPMLIMNPFTVRNINWDWVPGGAEVTPSTPRIRDLRVALPDSPYFEGVDVSTGVVQFNFWSEDMMQVTVDSADLNGTTIGWTDRRENDTDPEVEDGDYHSYPWIHVWDGTEESFYPGGSQAPGGLRILFLAQNPDNIEYYRHAGRQIFLNAISIAITGDPDPIYFPPDIMKHQELPLVSNARVLMLTNEGDEDHAMHVAYTDLLSGYFPGMTVNRSAAFATGDEPLSPAQMEQLGSYDLIVMPRVTSIDNYNTLTWNDVPVPLISFNSFAERRFQEPDPAADPPFGGYSGWSWWSNSTGGTVDLQNMGLVDINHPIYSGFAMPSAPTLQMFTEEINTRRAITVPSRIHGAFLGATAGDMRRSWITAWHGGEPFGHFDDNGVETNLPAPAAARVAYLVPGADGDPQHLTAEAVELLFNSVNWLLNQGGRRGHMAETFENYTQTRPNPWEQDLSAWGVMPTIHEDSSTWGAAPNVAVLTLHNEGWGGDNAVWRVMENGPQIGQDVSDVEWSFKVRLNDASATSVSSDIALGKDTGQSGARDNMMQGNAAAIRIHQQGGSNEIRYLSAGGVETAVAAAEAGAWYQISATLDLSEQVYSLAVVNLDNPDGSGQSFFAEDIPFIEGVDALDYVAVFNEENFTHYLNISLDDIFVVTRLPAVEATGYAAWRALHFPDSGEDDSIGGPGADPDGDGIPNAVEFAFGGDPTVPNRAFAPVIDTVEDGQDVYLQIVFLRDPGAEGAEVIVERASSLGIGDWTELPGPFDTEAADGGLVRETWRDTEPLGAAGSAYLRVRVELFD